MQENIILIVCGVFGVFFQSLLKIRSLLKDAQVANVDFRWKRDYVIKDAPSILMPNTLPCLILKGYHLC
jgi:hypothetical protein